MSILKIKYRAYYTHRLLIIPSTLLGISFYSPLSAYGTALTVICIPSNNGKCIIQGEGSIGGDGGAGGNNVGAAGGGGGNAGNNSGVTNTPNSAILKTQINYMYRKQEANSKPQPLTSDSVLQSGDIALLVKKLDKQVILNA